MTILGQLENKGDSDLLAPKIGVLKLYELSPHLLSGKLASQKIKRGTDDMRSHRMRCISRLVSDSLGGRRWRLWRGQGFGRLSIQYQYILFFSGINIQLSNLVFIE